MNYHFVLIRGLIREAGHWAPFLSPLRQAFPGSSVHCLDIPGAGVHFRSPTPPSIPEIVRAMRADFLALKLGADRPIVLVAISLGGMVAAQWMHEFPDDFQRAVLINTSFGGQAPLWERLKPRALGALLPVPLLKGVSREKRILSVVSNHQDIRDAAAEACAEIARQRPVSLANTARQLWAAASFQAPMEKPKPPVLLLASTHDRMVDVRCSRRIAQAWKTTAVEHSTAGHDLPTDDPEWVLKRLLDFLTR